MVQVQQFGTGTRYKLEILHQCPKRVKTSEKISEANSYVCRSYRRKTSGLPILNRVKVTKTYWTSTGKAKYKSNDTNDNNNNNNNNNNE